MHSRRSVAGSAGYLTHNAHTGLVLIGEGQARVGGRPLSGRDALAQIGLQPLVLGAKEGLSLVNGTACATGLSSVALARAAHLLDWADAIAALTLEAAGCQMDAFNEAVLALRPSKGIAAVGAALRARLQGSGLIAAACGRRTQDALSLRAVPHAHGAARDVFDSCAVIVDRELASATDNPAILGTPEQPIISSQAHAVAPALGQAADSLAIAIAQIAAMSERRIDRLVNPLVSGLPPFLATDAGSHSGFMIAQYTAAALVGDNRRLAAPASTDGGLTSGLQEDFWPIPRQPPTSCSRSSTMSSIFWRLNGWPARRPMISSQMPGSEQREPMRSTAWFASTSHPIQTTGHFPETLKRFAPS